MSIDSKSDITVIQKECDIVSKIIKEADDLIKESIQNAYSVLYPLAKESKPENTLLSQLEEYCCCSILGDALVYTNTHPDLFSPVNEKYSTKSESEDKEKTDEGEKIKKDEKKFAKICLDTPTESRAIYLRENLDGLYESLDEIKDDEQVYVESRKKLRYTAETISKRRSQYTGVFKNGTKWQSLISIKMKKTYIQTYKTEEKAAQAFDLMSMILKKDCAITNFNYTKREVLTLISKYKDVIKKFCQ
ncbi:unnamed protein product [Moneuplotes crassus]|uniref:AP2/ERF domain-containing protein n=1 Tax=Euplotes crassus TaxID=5936 RepID=A0AAD1YAH4_EUPCR|nr:unnamed protein product [Moneuplotes crassus]